MIRVGRHGVALVGVLVIVVSAVLAALAPALAPADPIRNDLLSRLTPPMWMDGGTGRHPLGTDTLGRDVVSRLLYGARVSLLVGFAAVLVAGVVGVVLGLVAGYYGGRLDDLLMRLGDVQLAFPVLVLAIAVLSVLGASLGNVIVVLGLTGWVTYARIARAETLTLRRADYIAAVQLMGGSPWRIVWRHIMPLCVSSVIVRVTLDMAGIIITAAGLGFLGLGAQPPMPEWGAMIANGRLYVLDQWWVAAAPGAAIFVVSLAFNLLGDGLRDALDPKAAK